MKKVTKNYLGRNFKRTRTKDRLSIEQRSVLMSKIRSKDTDFEQNFITLLKKSIKVKFHTHDKSILGKPDIVFNKQKICVFLDSDFWHGWHYPRWKHLLKNDFWRNKIERNRRRDMKVNRYLRSQGWTVIRIWEHNIKKDSPKSVEIIINSLKKLS